ncbi:hypothetical protein N7495_009419 [Penicillium taxi]|uniref:uncharacterized protein n=1 Tax=Penicillium taxi TaxID=168475 RepID=UPI002544DD84|nr:uncharacterized protein N7495_009419 [Penicillium taxi]KAJ5884909.1 hypothetical protein N7495_009419 [Penicillium taxi]
MADPQQFPHPGRNRGFSIKSEKSRRSDTSGHKSQLSESSQDKARRNLHTKADPLVAMNELQPMAVALEKSNLGSLREMQHKDQFGNIITDPDWSNPTRPRFERPLDTIRSFENAIYGTYSATRRASYARTDDAASQMGDYSRRTSYYGPNNGQQVNRGQFTDHYGRSNPSRPDSFVDGYAGGQENQARRPRPQRRPVEQSPYGHQQRSQDNVAALNGASGSNNPYDSSMDKLQQHAMQQSRMDEHNQTEYGVNDFSAGPNMSEGIRSPAPSGPPKFGAPATNNLLKKGGGKEDKKSKSWLKRRFSKN